MVNTTQKNQLYNFCHQHGTETDTDQFITTFYNILDTLEFWYKVSLILQVYFKYHYEEPIRKKPRIKRINKVDRITFLLPELSDNLLKTNFSNLWLYA